MRELRALPDLGVPAIASQQPHGCDLDTQLSSPTGCYFSFPYFFPLSGILGSPDGRGSVYATSIEPSPGQAAVAIAPPIYPRAERLIVEHLHTNSSRDGKWHRLSLRLMGPAQMSLVFPEERLVGWSLAPGLPLPRRSPFAPQERVVFAFLTSGGGDSAGGGVRVWDLWLEVKGSEAMSMAVYGHHVSSTKTPELELLAQRLPASLRGDWHWSASSLVRRTIALN